MTIAEQRQQAVAETREAIRAIEAEQGVTRESLAAMREQLIALAGRHELFPPEDFPQKDDTSAQGLHELAEDDDGRFAMYLVRGGNHVDTPPHNHTTWAIVVSVEGEELNKFYERTDDGSVDGKASLEQTGEFNIVPGTGVCLMPDDIHSIHMRGDGTKMHLHTYGIAIPRMTERVRYDMDAGTYERFLPHPDLR